MIEADIFCDFSIRGILQNLQRDKLNAAECRAGEIGGKEIDHPRHHLHLGQEVVDQVREGTRERDRVHKIEATTEV